MMDQLVMNVAELPLAGFDGYRVWPIVGFDVVPLSGAEMMDYQTRKECQRQETAANRGQKMMDLLVMAVAPPLLRHWARLCWTTLLSYL